MTPDHGELLYEGKAKRVFASADPDRVLVEFKNDATAFNAQKKAQLENKGRLNCQISARLFELLEREGVLTHYCGLAGETWMQVRRVEIIPLEVVLRNTATGSLCRQTPIAEGTPIDPALLDLYYKNDALGDPLLTEARVHLLGVADPAQLSAIEQLARRVNGVLRPFFEEIDLQLVDFKLEMGLASDGTLLLADEISPDTCRLWDRRNSNAEDRILDKDRFRKDLGGVMEAYGEVLKRVQGTCANPRNCL
ncbi:phosphoribosylaminoimidazolesuccinocarboxamide synthase [Synechococcus sp. HB1133]|uniref:phosphoribosylaminoimidazolesuccinocarboxamide synthase n=1 Tax=unclassified Synechococcus TaxID=2626047 RepID=UPI00140E4652|nr:MULTISPECIES: phosphoribosylaminoimidazolesuccinocarboxamide synthase [unclassified Synechococcus]MCB4394383.1 phosphoribosylaminoimidazolesuccinocarboxamide synthase [Synechococcus sp. PH41509]MCB4423344.1 phosphoribosylaminoimidazolesuccinocarboxamide synthase [Synechococcus sp. HB1133]MCB4430830.1 phosphoribosylaminoimidazolesuccinocarboxamide synthase [Synechococcus sp. HBA1120]NHI82292.1 phosphoribosylaminoimidazolesuccinocarboxamide synthase [Synechococcus sp. HB1133]